MRWFLAGMGMIASSIILPFLPHNHRWKVIRTIWPYPDGWGVWCEGCDTLMYSGLSKEEARALCEMENEQDIP